MPDNHLEELQKKIDDATDLRNGTTGTQIVIRHLGKETKRLAEIYRNLENGQTNTCEWVVEQEIKYELAKAEYFDAEADLARAKAKHLEKYKGK